MNLKQNELRWAIPSKTYAMLTLAMLYISQNALMKIISLKFENATTLDIFNVSYNNLYGKLPIQGIFKSAKPYAFVENLGLC